ncbi:Short chain dehydrogenase [Lachnellula subtilissima]|uniref:Short chain dehydrogenase n=1 Tax=Lachnellula subtilissima TaxID=602034 RepID=A0A8H8U4P5_9HELO|nr:Short chain dehydrogenase [Lachnellula subtilissima]
MLSLKNFQSSIITSFLTTIHLLHLLFTTKPIPNLHFTFPDKMTTEINWPSYTKTWHRSSYPSISPSRPELSLAGKSVIVTGGGTGIGAAIALSAAQAGASHLAIIGRRSALLAQTAERIKAATNSNTHILPVTADLTNKKDVDKALEFIQTSFGAAPLDILISNAGFFTGAREIGKESVEEWSTNLDVNIKAVVLVVSAFLPRAADHATIINISSGMAHLPAIPGASSYSVTKLAATKFIEYVAAAHPEKRVVNVHPGQVAETELAGKHFEAVGMKVEDNHIDDVQLAGNFAIWTASPEAAFVNGKFLWCNWDVDELKESKEEIQGSSILTTNLEGWSSFKYHA